ncbi:conserved hypothetical protein [Magnetococcus marinus MC-1]|uniref:6-hydroxymethylpterin diphosphokinase MptE-like domain-containing protein n=1 Tax=Magnetococcus marinus (strain ATCC BAA-1437 / JCM 17883 / MC-1) TaxID=156889 RepID=A0L9M3_MAGMM|nr:6-hydroxymethylpterin diphosphokinase MptE-like protein [Magnetococcus marinus]ABK44666.1 conserved hypothetical protein [Magnetococcus marinus MC-1]
MNETTSFDLGQILTNNFGERYLQGINGESFSRMGSVAYFKQHYGKALWGPDKLTIVLGTDSGLLVHYILEHIHAEDTTSRVLFIELEDVLERLQQEELLPKTIPGRVDVVSMAQWLERAKEAFNFSDYLFLDAVNRVQSVGAQDALHPHYLGQWDSLTNEFLQFSTVVKMQTGNQIFAHAGLKNLAENRLRAQQLHGLFKGKTAVILAGGPSLLESLAHVKANRDKLVVIAVARIAGTLLKEQITPDFIFSIDPHEVSFNNSHEMLHFWEKSFFVNLYHVTPMLLGQWRGRSAYIGPLFPWKNEIDGENQLPSYPGITVSHQAIGCAIDMGFSQIILCGIDLCFSKEGYTHAKGSMESQIGPFLADSSFRVETNAGDIAESRFDFYSAIPSLAYLAAYAEEKGCQLINPAPQAAKIERVAHLGWDTLNFAPMAQPVTTYLQEQLPPETRASRLAHYELVLTELLHARNEISQVRKLAEEALVCNKRLFGKKGKPGDYSAKLRMDQIEETLDKQHPTFSTLVKQWGIQSFLRLIRADKEKAWTDEEIELTGERYYQAYKQGAQQAVQLLNETIHRVQMRIEEEKPKPNLKNLLRQWEEDAQPNRLTLFTQRQQIDLAGFPDKLRSRFALLQAQFDNQLSQEEAKLKLVLATSGNIITARNKLRNLFRHQSMQALKDLRNGLMNSQFEFKHALNELTQGYILELEGELEAAMDCYAKVERPELFEEAQTHMLQILLKQNRIEESLPVLEAMANFNPSKLPYYATMLGLTGRAEAAKVAFDHYLELAPQDLLTRLKYAQMLFKNQRHAACQQQLQRILAQDASNQAAQQMLAQLNT